MNVKELKKMLENSLGSNRGKYIPWWTCEFDREMYRYNIFTEEEVQDVEACLSECSKDDIASTDCSWGLSLFHLLVWHNFYNAVEKAGYTRHKHNTGSYVYGLKLREGQDFL